jgi:hypothetical protein
VLSYFFRILCTYFRFNGSASFCNEALPPQLEPFAKNTPPSHQFLLETIPQQQNRSLATESAASLLAAALVVEPPSTASHRASSLSSRAPSPTPLQVELLGVVLVLPPHPRAGLGAAEHRYSSLPSNRPPPPPSCWHGSHQSSIILASP